MNFSDEQSKYIFDNKDQDSILLATAGSGKTLCIVEKIRNLSSSEVLVLTFSRNARSEFVNKMMKNGVDTIPLENICTIDSFSLRCVNEKLDISLLTYALFTYLKNENFEHEIFKRIKHIFVDEAQDLNEIQYNILLMLKQKCNANLHLIGDPNQNIYQFRNSCSDFLMKHKANIYTLSTNYRSGEHIVDFCSYLRQYSSFPLNSVFSQKEKGKLTVTFYMCNTDSFERYLINLVNFIIEKKIPLHKCAILSPTRGYLRDVQGHYNYKGLCYISNLLFHHQIPFQQIYFDTKNNDCNNGIKYKPQYGKINLLTYTASKGLEWDYVILTDANCYLISKMNYDNSIFNAERNLLYVACSRARKNLFIFAKKHNINPWFENIPHQLFSALPNYEGFKVFDKKKLIGTNQAKRLVELTSINEIIDSMSPETLLDLNKILNKSISVQSFNITRNKPWKFQFDKKGFLSKFLENIFYAYIGNPKINIDEIEKFVSCTNVIVCSNQSIIHWYHTNKNNYDWITFYQKKPQIPEYITRFIEEHFDKRHAFSSFNLVDKFYHLFISNNNWINTHIQNYKKNPEDAFEVLILTLIEYAIETSHYFYIVQHSEFEKAINDKNMRILQELQIFCKNVKERITSVDIKYEIHNIYVKIDFIMDDEIVMMNTHNIEITLKNILYCVISNLLTNQYKKTFKVINILNGTLHNFNVSDHFFHYVAHQCLSVCQFKDRKLN